MLCGSLDARGVWGRMDTWMYMAESLCCPPETITTLLIGYVKWKSLHRVWLFATPWITQPLEFSRPEYWSGLPFPSLGDLPNPGIELRSPALQADSLPAGPRGWSEVKSLSRVRLFATLWTVAYQAPPSTGFSRQEYWSGLLFPSPGDLLYPGIEPGFPALEADALISETTGKPNSNIR